MVRKTGGAHTSILVSARIRSCFGFFHIQFHQRTIHVHFFVMSILLAVWLRAHDAADMGNSWMEINKLRYAHICICIPVSCILCSIIVDYIDAIDIHRKQVRLVHFAAAAIQPNANAFKRNSNVCYKDSVVASLMTTLFV